jgi:hypothetical protein
MPFKEPIMSQPIPMRGRGPARVLALAVIAAALCGDRAAAQWAPAPAPGPPPWLPGQPLPPRGPFFGPPALPAPSPNPYAPAPYLFLSPGGVIATDRLVVAAPPTIDPDFVKTARAIDPGIYAPPRVLGLPIQTPGWRLRR